VCASSGPPTSHLAATNVHNAGGAEANSAALGFTKWKHGSIIDKCQTNNVKCLFMALRWPAHQQCDNLFAAVMLQQHQLQCKEVTALAFF